VKQGKVYLIGAGPGDVELLTLKGVRALKEAGIILIDDLVNREVLQFASPRARVIEVGKRGGCKSTPQAFIDRLMVRYARAGHIVARVKGGDPFVFGRGGEELAMLRAAGIEAEVVNGITAGISVPAAIGIPVTHRDCTHGVSFVTGHTRDGVEPDWQALAAGGTTLVIYMGIARLGEICARLRAAGMAPGTPAAVIQHGTLAQQRSVVSALGRLPAAVDCAGLGSPAIVIIGDVVRFATGQCASEPLPDVA
jgi:uroporphyrin-III C-methyltransferase